MPHPGFANLGQLRESGWTSRSVKDEVRQNAIERIKAGDALFPGVLGYEDTVLPQLENALLAGHDVIFLGERGQAKTRMIRSITELLDESSVTKEAPIFERARATTRVADVVVQRFSSFIDAAVQESSFGEAQQLQLLRMRLIRDYSGLWLLVNRPSSN